MKENNILGIIVLIAIIGVAGYMLKDKIGTFSAYEYCNPDNASDCTNYDNETLATCFDLVNYSCIAKTIVYDNRLVTEPCLGNNTYTSNDTCQTALNIKRGCAVDANCTRQADAPNDCTWNFKAHKINQTGFCAQTGCQYIDLTKDCSGFATFMQKYKYIVYALLVIIAIIIAFAIFKKN